MAFYKLFKDIDTSVVGAYIVYKVIASPELAACFRLVDAEAITEADAHVTVIISTQPSISNIVLYAKALRRLPATIIANVIDVELFDGTSLETCSIVLSLSCLPLVTMHKQLQSGGLQHVRPEYNPHLTLKYDVARESADDLKATLKSAAPTKLTLTNLTIKQPK